MLRSDRDGWLIAAAAVFAAYMTALLLLGGVRWYSPVPYYDMWQGDAETLRVSGRIEWLSGAGSPSARPALRPWLDRAAEAWPARRQQRGDGPDSTCYSLFLCFAVKHN
ncbi:hypothetical protein [Limibacillus halophilus]